MPNIKNAIIRSRFIDIAGELSDAAKNKAYIAESISTENASISHLAIARIKEPSAHTLAGITPNTMYEIVLLLSRHSMLFYVVFASNGANNLHICSEQRERKMCQCWFALLYIFISAQ